MCRRVRSTGESSEASLVACACAYASMADFTTRARWLSFATLRASSSTSLRRPACRSAPTLATKRVDVARERRDVIRRSKNTVSEPSPMIANTTATTIAGTPMWLIMSVQLNPIAISFVWARPRSGRQLEGDADDPEGRDRLAFEAGRPVAPLLHGVGRRAGERL